MDRSEIGLIVMLCVYCFTLVTSLIFWFVNYTSIWLTDTEEATCSATRWIAAMMLPVFVVHHGLRKNSLNRSGAMAGLFVGFVLTLSGWRFLAMLLTFFITSSKATRFKSDRKRKLESNYKEGGERDWRQVLCNGGAACQLACLYLIECGCTERPINFHTDFHSSLITLAVLGALSAANADTWASELGTVLSSSQPRLITTLKSVPKGTNGGVSVSGFVASLLGGAAVGASCWLTQQLVLGEWQLRQHPAQWPLVTVAMVTGLAGSLVDSLLGATLQYSGVCAKTGVVVERPGADVKHISGVCVLDNHAVNLLSTSASACIAPLIAIYMWPAH